MVITLQTIDVFRINTCFSISLNNFFYIQIFRIHVFKTINQYDQAVASLDSFYKTNTSVTCFNISIRFILTYCSNRICKAYQIFTRSSMNTMCSICWITISIYVMRIFSTRSTFNCFLILTRYRNQILRFDITKTACYINCINTE